ncbi:MAG: SgcJ/EcaC family oxidoreductase [Roseinatronobacter sp.]
MTPTPAARSEIASLLDTWFAALETCNPATVAALYAPDATLLPTISNKTRATPEDIHAYFERFLQLRPKGRKHAQNISVYERVAINSGVYGFVTDGAESNDELICRFTFVYRKDAEGWKIIEHHSSRMPEPIMP